MRLCVRVHSIDDMVDACVEALSGQGFEAAAVVGHSYGSMVAARLARTRPAMVHSLGLLDPVRGCGRMVDPLAALGLSILLLNHHLTSCCHHPPLAPIQSKSTSHRCALQCMHQTS